MSKLDDILTNLEFQAIVQHDESTGVEIRSEAKLQVKETKYLMRQNTQTAAVLAIYTTVT